MFKRIRRFFGGGAPLPDDRPRGSVAAIVIQGDGSGALSSGARLVARDGSGAFLLNARVTIGIDPVLVAQLDPTRPANAFPEGDYVVDAVLPAREDAAGAALFGPHPMLRLRARIGETTPPPLYGRTILLIHGGPAGRPTDGSVRMADGDLTALLGLLPADPGQVLVRLIRPTEGETGGEDLDRDDDNGRDWSGGDDSALFYEQLYAWTGTASGLPPYPDLPARTSGDDGAVASALADLGYAVLPDPGGPTLDAAGAAAAGATAGAAEVSATDPGWMPAGGAYGR